VPKESQFTQPRDECPHPEYWTAHDDGATENEVIEGVHGLIRLLQPEYVIETGTHRGFMAQAIGRALRMNGHGVLDTIEIDQKYLDEAASKCHGLPVRIYNQDASTFKPAAKIDFAWIDTSTAAQRKSEFVAFYPHFRDQALVAFHDAGTHYHDHVRRIVWELFNAGALSPIFLRTPRGLALCEVTKKE
jgi:predicted O-methyltransferase YrrM